MKSVALLLFAVVFLLASEAARAQWSKGGSGGSGWGGSATGGGQWGGATGQPSQPRQPPPTPRQPPASPQQPGWTSPPARPQPPVHVIPGRPAPGHTPQKPRPVIPPGSSGWWGAPFPPSVTPHWRRDRFFRHRPRGLVFFGVPEFTGTTVIVEAAPGVIREERLQSSPASDPVRDPGQLAPYDPTPQEVVDRMLTLANVRKNDVIYDLGSGDGRLLITAAKKYGVRGVGFEIEPDLVKLARENVRRAGVEKLVTIRQQDFLSVDLSPASVVTLYLSFDGNLAVREQLNRQLKPGARVVSYTFDMGDWPPKIAESYRDAAGETHAIYLWQITEAGRYNQSSSEIIQPESQRSSPMIIEVR